MTWSYNYNSGYTTYTPSSYSTPFGSTPEGIYFSHRQDELRQEMFRYNPPQYLSAPIVYVPDNSVKNSRWANMSGVCTKFQKLVVFILVISAIVTLCLFGADVDTFVPVRICLISMVLTIFYQIGRFCCYGVDCFPCTNDRFRDWCCEV